MITANTGKQFMARKFKEYIANMGIIVKNVPIQAHHFIYMVEHYHGPLRRVYFIITLEISSIKPDLVLQMFSKAINDSASPNKLVSTLLVFGVYPRMTGQDASSSLMTQHAIAMQNAMDVVQKCAAS